MVGRIIRRQPRQRRHQAAAIGWLPSIVMPRTGDFGEAVGLALPLLLCGSSIARHNRPSSGGRPWWIAASCLYSMALPRFGLPVKRWACKASIAAQLIYLAVCLVRIYESNDYSALTFLD